MSFYVLYVFGLHFHGGGQKVGYLHHEAALAGAAHGEEASAVSVERTSDHFDFLAVHVGGYLLGEVVEHVVGLPYGRDETVHIGVAHRHGLVDGGASAVAVLQGGYALYLFVERLLGGACEEQVGNHGHLTADAAAGLHGDFPLERGEHLVALLAELYVRGTERVASLEVAQHKPLFLSVFHDQRGARGQFSKSCLTLYRDRNQAVTSNEYKVGSKLHK